MIRISPLGRPECRAILLACLYAVAGVPDARAAESPAAETPAAETPAAETPAAETPPATDLDAALVLQRVVEDAIARAERSVVAIARYRTDGPPISEPRVENRGEIRARLGLFNGQDEVPAELAAGVVLDRNGYILTNYHVLGDPRQNRYVVVAGQRPFDVTRVMTVDQVLAADPWTDLAVLKIEADDLEPIALGNATNLRKGQFVISLGNPLNIARDGEVSASWGIVSHLSRKLPDDSGLRQTTEAKTSLYHYGGLIQTDARLNMGTSGGALIDLRGELVGLTTALASLEGYEKSLGFAIPVDEVFRRTVQTLKTGRKAEFGFLGVAPAPLSDALLRQGQHGVRVSLVVPATPAAAAGLREGDIITRLNDQPIYDSDALMCALGRLGVGADARLVVERGTALGKRGQVIHTTAHLTKKYVPAGRPPFAQIQDPTWRGMIVEYATAALPPAQLQHVLISGIPAGTLAALEVQRESPAWKAGLRPGSLFTHVAGQRVETPEQFHAAVQGQDGPVTLQLVSGDAKQITVEP
jgi:serine protease Do